MPVVKIPHFHCRVSGSRSLFSELRPWKLHHVVKKERKKLVNLISQFKLDGITKHSLALTSLSEHSVPLPNTEVFNEVLI